MICNSCGSNIPDGSAVCPNCGAPVTAGTPGTQVPSGMGGGAFNANFFQRESASINFIALGVAVVGLICTLLAKVTLTEQFFGTSESQGIMSLYGGLIIALFVITAVMVFLRRDNAALIPAVINAVFCIFKTIQQLGVGNAFVKVSLGFFFWLMVLAAIAEVAVILVLPKVLGNKN